MSEAIIHIYYWFGYEVGVYLGAIRQGLDQRKLTLLASVRLVRKQVGLSCVYRSYFTYVSDSIQ